MKKFILFLSPFLFFNANAQVTSSAGPDRQICLFDTLTVTGSGLNPGDTGSYQWTDLNSNTIISQKESFSLKITSLTSRSYELKVTRDSNKVTYTALDTFILTVSPLPTFKFKGLPPRCYDDGCINLTLNILASATQGNDTSKKYYDLRYFQKFRKPSWVTGGPVGKAPYTYCPNNFISNSQVPPTGLRDTICYEYRDNNGCYNHECKPIMIYPNPVVQVKSGIYCQKNGVVNLDALVTIPFNRTGGIESWRCVNVPNGSGVNPGSIVMVNNSTSPAKHSLDIGLEGENKKTGDYIMEYCFKNPTTGCQRCDSSTVTAIRLPEIVFDSVPPQCTNGQLLNLDSIVRDNLTGKRISGVWQCVAYNGSRNISNSQVSNAINNGVKSQKYFDPRVNASGGKYLLKIVTNSGGCPETDSVEITVNGLPMIQLSAPDSVCANSGKYNLKSNYQTGDPNGQWSGEYISNGELNSDLANLGSSYSKMVKARFTYQHPVTKCINSDSQYTTLIKKPAFKFVQTVKKNSTYLVNFDLIDSNMNMSQFKWSWDYGNGATSNDKYPREVLYMDSGVFKAFLTISNGLCDTRDSIIFPLNKKASGISNIYKQIMVYPNPVSHDATIRVPFDGTVMLSDMNGKQLFLEQIHSNETKLLKMDLLSPGLYILTFENDKMRYHVKLLKE